MISEQSSNKFLQRSVLNAAVFSCTDGHHTVVISLCVRKLHTIQNKEGISHIQMQGIISIYPAMAMLHAEATAP